MAIYLFLNLKIPFVGFASPFFLVARLRKFAEKIIKISQREENAHLISHVLFCSFVGSNCFVGLAYYQGS
jgi:hypothetical protein